MTNLTIEATTEGLTAIAFNFDFSITTKEEGKAHELYIDFIFNQMALENLTNEEFNKACNAIIKTEATLFGKMPKVAMFLKYAGKQKLTIEQQAEIQVERILDESGYAASTLFDNPFTNATVHKYGGLYKLYYDLNGYDNSNKKSRNWVKKELVDIWLTCKADNKGSNYPCVVNGNKERINFIGNNRLCQRLLDQSKQIKEFPKPIEAIIKNIGYRKPKLDWVEERRKLNDGYYF